MCGNPAQSPHEKNVVPIKNLQKQNKTLDEEVENQGKHLFFFFFGGGGGRRPVGGLYLIFKFVSLTSSHT